MWLLAFIADPHAGAMLEYLILRESQEKLFEQSASFEANYINRVVA